VAIVRNGILISLVFFTFLGNAFASDIGARAWNRSNISTLRGADKAAVAEFINSTLKRGSLKVQPSDVTDFAWGNGGGGNSNLLTLLDFSGRGVINIVTIYSRGPAGKIKSQEIFGWHLDSLGRRLRDLNGDGKDELIVPTEIAAPGTWFPSMDTPTWPAVYELEGGRYVDGSRDFPNFYNTEILPALDKSVARLQHEAGVDSGFGDALAQKILERDKILRVLGRNPTAGLSQAYVWMNSDDPQLLQCAVATFRDIGGHDEEMRAAQKKIGPAINHEMAARKGG
jgi:hypothetical protein